MEEGEPCRDLKSQGIALGSPRNRTKQKPGSLLTPPRGPPSGRSKRRNEAAARARGPAYPGSQEATSKIYYRGPALCRSPPQLATQRPGVTAGRERKRQRCLPPLAGAWPLPAFPGLPSRRLRQSYRSRGNRAPRANATGTEPGGRRVL